MEKTYDPFAIEQKIYKNWEQCGYFAPKANGTSYCIMIPPPNVTGSLHMGHGFQQTLMDALIRYHRMRGDNTLWQMGTDHAGISTQMVVERQLAEAGKNRVEMGREAFVDEVWHWRKRSGTRITEQMRRLGVSVDWQRERFTLDEDLSHAVQEVFIRLYEEGLIYRGKRLVNWDPYFRTAISDLEVNSGEEAGSLWYLRYPLTDAPEYFIVATTRPETMLGDAAVAVNPDDNRYKKYIGKTIKLPLTDREIPIIADDYVDMEFGTGCVKITPAHDFNDYDIGQRHGLPLINIFTADAKINNHAPNAYQGMDRFDARERIIADLRKLNLLEKIEKYKVKIPRADRGNTIVEPYLTDQWYVKATTLAEPAIKAVEQGDITFVPENWSKTYFQWMHNIQDWCISRQLWWGHRIPAWYDDHGTIYVGRNEKEIRKKYALTSDVTLHQDADVLDTWFSSALWPFATLGWPKQTTELNTFYPTDVLVTGFDIIFFWIARMIMMALKFTSKAPFKEVYITGLIRDSEGQKMSKTKGNVLDPIDLIDGIELEALIRKRKQGLIQPSMAKHIEKNTRREFPKGIPRSGTDALRFTYCALATTGRDIRFDLNRLEGYRNFCNKIWNAARFVLMNIENDEYLSGECAFSLADRYIQSCLQETIKKVHMHFRNYRFDLIAQSIYDFCWHEYCDWYLELAKSVLMPGQSSAAQQCGARKTLVDVLETLLRLMHPLMPFISEEIWQAVKSYAGKTGATIMLEPYPEVDISKIDHSLYEEVAWLKDFIMGIRNIRGEMNIPPNKKLAILLHKGNQTDRERVKNNFRYLKTLAKLETLTWLGEGAIIPPAATALVSDLELLIPLASIINKTAELKRLTKEFDKIDRDLKRSEKKLQNPNYIAKAPEAVVNKERQLVSELHLAKSKLTEKISQIEALS